MTWIVLQKKKAILLLIHEKHAEIFKYFILYIMCRINRICPEDQPFAGVTQNGFKFLILNIEVYK